jgi:hypothetical protein
MTDGLLSRSTKLLNESKESHQGVFLTGPNQIELLSDELPSEVTTENDFVLASFGNCRCASDAKAIRQFDSHARVPSGVDRVALGHETLQMVLQAPGDSDFKPGDIVVMPVSPLIRLVFFPRKMVCLQHLVILISIWEDCAVLMLSPERHLNSFVLKVLGICSIRYSPVRIRV